MAIVHNAPISGFMKLWLYQKFVLGMLSWPLMIQDLNLDFVKTQLTRPCGVILKKWAGAFDSIDVGCLYRPKERFGLELTPVSVLFKKLQVIKLHLLKNSPDPHISRWEAAETLLWVKRPWPRPRLSPGSACWNLRSKSVMAETCSRSCVGRQIDW